MQDGVEIANTDGGLISKPLNERARFVRLESSFGRHRAWVLVHDTSSNCRSLAASTYRFRRGSTAVESRWQWRPATNVLLSVFGERRVSHVGTSVEAAEVGVSFMPRRRWGWRIGLESSFGDGESEATAWDV